MGTIQCTQTGGESIAKGCFRTNSPRAQYLFRRGQHQQHHPKAKRPKGQNVPKDKTSQDKTS